MNELKPCPFCGYNADGRDVYGERERNPFAPPPKRVAYIIKCKKCNATMRYATRKTAIDAWNRRVTDAK